MAELEPHQERVVHEKNELDDKIGKLHKFTSEGTVFNTLSSEEKNDLREQLYVMQSYSEILHRRISRF